jgi:hypothetical protein
MTAVLKKVLGYKPLIYWKDQLLVSKGSSLFLADHGLKTFQNIGRLPSTLAKRVAAYSRMLTRLLRFEAGPARALEDGLGVLVCHEGAIYRVEPESGAIELDFKLARGHRPLQLTYVSAPGFDRGIYFGEYLSNADKSEVHIYHRATDGAWKIAHTFPHGEINHIHNIIEDKDNNCLYILSGDFGSGAAIWRAENNFASITRIAAMGQASRACWLEVRGDTLVYATDTQLETNHVNSLSLKPSNFGCVTQHFTIVGSSIYRAEGIKEALIFSTAVEPDQVHGNKYLALFSSQRGAGILTNDACIYQGTLDHGFDVIFKAKKDFLPFRLFQFGTFQFPAGSCSTSGLIHAYGTAVSGCDGSTVLISMKETGNERQS